MVDKETLSDIVKDCPCKDRFQWCFLKELIVHIGLSKRQIEQLRLIYDYKYFASQKNGGDIGEERASLEFIEKYSKKFADVYQEGITREDLFNKVFEDQRG